MTRIGGGFSQIPASSRPPPETGPSGGFFERLAPVYVRNMMTIDWRNLISLFDPNCRVT